MQHLPVSAKSIKALVFDFDGVFTDNFVYVDQNGIETVRCWRSDGLGIEKIRKIGLKLLILSTERNPVVQKRADKLKIACLHGISDKAAALQKWAGEQALKLNQIAYVGNDINDAGVLKIVGFPIGVADSHEDILPLLKHRTKCTGGRGAVREICDAFSLELGAV